MTALEDIGRKLQDAERDRDFLRRRLDEEFANTKSLVSEVDRLRAQLAAVDEERAAIGAVWVARADVRAAEQEWVCHSMVDAKDLIEYEACHRRDFSVINHPDAQIIVAARNALPALLAERRALVVIAEAARKLPLSPRYQVEADLIAALEGYYGAAPIICRQCGKREVEEARRHYATPVCYACLPPPEPLPVTGGGKP